MCVDLPRIMRLEKNKMSILQDKVLKHKDDTSFPYSNFKGIIVTDRPFHIKLT